MTTILLAVLVGVATFAVGMIAGAMFERDVWEHRDEERRFREMQERRRSALSRTIGARPYE